METGQLKENSECALFVGESPEWKLRIATKRNENGRETLAYLQLVNFRQVKKAG